MRVLPPCLAGFFSMLVAAGMVAAFPGASVAAENDPSALCQEAEERYVELYGKPSSEQEGVTIVTMYKYEFCPAAITVQPGTTVRWVNVDKRTSHSVLVPDSGAPESDRAFPEETIEMTFLRSGDHRYLCGPHWETHDMIGMVTVAD